jgi:hypothetical protein
MQRLRIYTMSQSPFTTPSVVYLGTAYCDSSSATGASAGSTAAQGVSSPAPSR